MTMNDYHVYANAADFGIIKAATEQEARDKAAQIAGYESEADMERLLENPSEIECRKVDIESASAQFADWLADNLADPKDLDLPSVLNAWLNEIDENGHIEIPAHLSATGAPISETFPALRD